MTWETKFVLRRKLPWYKRVYIWMFIYIFMPAAEPVLMPYYLWRLTEEVRRAKQLSVPPLTFAVRTKRPAR